MRIMINGKESDLKVDTVLSELVHQLGYKDQSVAVVIDGKHVPKSMWAQKTLSDGQSLEFVAPMQGG